MGLRREFSAPDPYSCIQRWLFELTTRNATLHYVRGEENIADALSRLLDVDAARHVGKTAGLGDDVEHGVGVELVGSLSAARASSDENNAAVFSSLAAGEVVLEYDEASIAVRQREDKDFGPIIEYLTSGELPVDNARARKILLDSDNYVLLGENNILMRITEVGPLRQERTRLVVCIPRGMRTQVMQQHHDYAFGGAHLGRLKTLERIRFRNYWPNLPTDVKSYVKSCHVCQEVKRAAIPSTSVWEAMATAPGDAISIDLVGPLPLTARGSRYILSVIDNFTKFAYAIPISAKDPEIIARVLLEQVFRMHPPKRLISDQGKEFLNKAIKRLCELMNIKKVTTTAYHPNSNGFV